jgi:hypothetical protein
MNWLMMIMAVIGTALVTSRRSKVRLWAFIFWIITNIYWAIYAGDIALQVQFAIYFILAVVGVKNNIKEDK